MSRVDFACFDCDNHFYEPVDAFTRHLDPAFRRRGVQWAEINGRTRLLVGERINRYIPNPTFDPIARPGVLDEYFRGRNPLGAGTKDLFGTLEPISAHPEYRDRDARLALMDEQGLQGAILLPTLGVGMEQPLVDDPEALVAVFRAFNRWIDEDWGFAYKERIFAAPVFTLVDPDEAALELEWALEQDARFVLLLPGPVMTPGGGRSPSDPVYDPFWRLVEESGVTTVVHGSDSRYSRYLADWGEPGSAQAFRQSPFRALVSHNPVQDFFANLLAHGHFDRFPGLRIGSLENGCDWVFHLYEKLTKSFGQTPQLYPEDPRDTFRRHVFISPYYEDDLRRLRDLIGADRVLMGSDYPHAEGLAEPTAYIDDLRAFGFTDDEARLVMRENGLALSVRR